MRDIDIRTVGGIAGAMFDLLVIKEDDDRRGRKAGEIAALFTPGSRFA